jgi:photosystem II stability/assembly factor-like uncharacterized protein
MEHEIVNSTRLWLTVLALCALSCFGCETVSSTTSSPASSVALKKEPEKSPATMVDVVSSIKRSRSRLRTKIEAVPLPGNNSIQEIRFVGAKGWVVGKDQLFGTEDGGGNWQRLNIALPSGAHITGTLFGPGQTVWLALDRCAPDEFCDSHHLWLTVTQDGGKTWNTLHEENDVSVSSIYFHDDKNGWLAGARFKNPSSFAPLLLHTSDGGAGWKDVSDGIYTSLAQRKDQIRSPTHDDAQQLISGIGGALVVATGRLKIFTSGDNGLRWSEVGSIADDDRLQTALVGFGVLGDKYWMAGGAFSEEGIWSVLARQQNEKSWIRYSVEGVYLKHFYPIDQQKVLACGSLSEISGSTRKPPVGVIVASLDGGKSWKIIHEDPQIERFNFLTTDQSERLWVSGTGGILLRLERVYDIVAALEKD